MVVTLDWDQKQWCAVWFLRNHLGVCLEAVPDVTHRRQRDLDLSMGECHLKLVVTQGHIANNCTFGPWNGGGAMKDLVEIVVDLSQNMTENDPLVLQFWDRIVQDMSLGSEDDSSDGRRAFLQGLPNLPPFSVKGVKSAASRWASYQEGRKFHDKYLAAECMVLCHLGLRKGWFKTVASLDPSFSSLSAAGLSTMGGGGASAGAGCGGSRQANTTSTTAASSGDASAAPTPKAKTKAASAPTNSTFKAKQKATEERRRCKKTMHYVTKLLADEEFAMATRMICHTTDPEIKKHSKYLSEVKAVASQVTYFSEMAAGGYINDMADIIGTSFDLQGLSRVGFVCGPVKARGISAGGPEMQIQDSLAHVQMSLVLSLLKHRGTSFAWFSHTTTPASRRCCSTTTPARLPRASPCCGTMSLCCGSRLRNALLRPACRSGRCRRAH